MSELASALFICQQNNLANMLRDIAARLIAGEYPAPELDAVRPLSLPATLRCRRARATAGSCSA